MELYGVGNFNTRVENNDNTQTKHLAKEQCKHYVAVLFYQATISGLWAAVLEAVLAFMYTRLSELARGEGTIVFSYFGRNKSKNFPFQKALDY